MGDVVGDVVGDVHTVRDIDPGEFSNMSTFLAFDRTQAAPQRFCLNPTAFENISSISTTLDTSHFEISQLNDAVIRNMAGIASTLDTSHFERSPLYDCAPRNIEDMSFAPDTSQFIMLPLKKVL